MSQSGFTVDRRRFLKLSTSVTAWLLCTQKGLTHPVTSTLGVNRRLVVLEMNGGNDGLNTFVPFADPAYVALRPKIGLQPNQVLALDNVEGFGLHPALTLLQKRFNQGRLAIVQGVGHPQPDLSHFAMMDYWRAGHPQGLTQTGNTGWLGRMLDQLAPNGTELLGLSVADSVSPILYTSSAAVAAVDSSDAGELGIANERLATMYRQRLIEMTATTAGDSSLDLAARASRQGLDVGDFLALLPDNRVIYPDTDIGYQFSLAARLLAVNGAIPLKILHLPLPLDFDTHVNQPARHLQMLTELNGVLAAFTADLDEFGLADDTLILTVSEFGRRPAENEDQGTDHGTANCLFLLGSAVNGGVYGTAPLLTELDGNGNLHATSSYLDVLATVKQLWLGQTDNVPGTEGKLLDLFK